MDVQAMASDGFSNFTNSLSRTWNNIGAWPPLVALEYANRYAQDAIAEQFDNPMLKAVAQALIRAGSFGAAVEIYTGYST